MKSMYKYSLILLSCVLLVNLACEDIDLEGEEAGSVQGFWQLNETVSSLNTYLLVSEVAVIFYFHDTVENCIKVDAYDIVRIDGTGFYILSKEGLEENRVLALTRQNDRIIYRDIIDNTETKREIYYISSVDINTLAPVCVDPTDVFGQWELTRENEPTIHLSITPDSIKVIESIPDQECFFISEMEILEINGNVFTINDNDPNANSTTQEVTITRTAEGVEVERWEKGEIIKEVYLKSEADFSIFEPICNFGPLMSLAGKWQFEDSGVEDSPEFYMTISFDFMSFHFLVGDPINDPENVCFEIEQFEIVTVDDRTLSVKGTREPFEEVTLTLDYRETEGLLYLDDTQDVLAFFRTDIDDGYINNQCSTTSAN